MLFVFVKIYTLIKSYTTLTANPSTNEDNPLNSMFHRASKTTTVLKWVKDKNIFKNYMKDLTLPSHFLFTIS